MSLVMRVREGRKVYIGRQIEIRVIRVVPSRRFLWIRTRGKVELRVQDGSWDKRFVIIEDGVAAISTGVAVGFQPTDRENRLDARLSIDAPKWMAISRDDVSPAKHRAYCDAKEGRG